PPVLSGRDQASPTPPMTIPHPLRVAMPARIYRSIMAILRVSMTQSRARRRKPSSPHLLARAPQAGQQSPPASVAQTGTLRSWSRPELLGAGGDDKGNLFGVY